MRQERIGQKTGASSNLELLLLWLITYHCIKLPDRADTVPGGQWVSMDSHIQLDKEHKTTHIRMHIHTHTPKQTKNPYMFKWIKQQRGKNILKNREKRKRLEKEKRQEFRTNMGWWFYGSPSHRDLVFLSVTCVCVHVLLLFFLHPPISQGLKALSRAVWVGEVSANLLWLMWESRTEETLLYFTSLWKLHTNRERPVQTHRHNTTRK